MCPVKKRARKNLAKFTGQHLCQSLFFSKVAGINHATLLKQTLAQMFSCEFCRIFNNTFFIEHLRWLLLHDEICLLKIMLLFNSYSFVFLVSEQALRTDCYRKTNFAQRNCQGFLLSK